LPRYDPSVSLTDAAVAADLALAGLVFIERIQGEVQVPLPEFKSAASCRDEDGRFDSTTDEIVDVNDPEMPAKINAGWCRMATEYGLLDERREFLLSVNYRDPEAIDPELTWVRVRLGQVWDLAGSGSTALGSYFFSRLFTERFVPEFVMLSIDGHMLLNTTVWGNGTVSTIVIRPDRLDGSLAAGEA
jgi:hypothetical protein